MASCLGALQTRRFRKAVAILLALAFSTVIVLFLVNRVSSSPSFLEIGGTKNPASEKEGSQVSGVKTAISVPRCDNDAKSTKQQSAWRADVASKYGSHLEDKFTIALSTFHRPKQLKKILNALLSTKIPSLLEIVVIWNNFDEQEPETFTSDHGVIVRYRKPERDSLNEKLWPDPHYRTQAILLSDDDVFYRPEDLEFVFQMWRKFGKDRLTGALGRCASLTKSGDWNYNFCSQREHEDVYALILTNLAFIHIAFLDHYFSDKPAMKQMREYVDKAFNCEDIALNFVASSLTGSGPLLVRGRHQYVNLDPSGGISRQSGHMEARSKCLNEFAAVMQCMPLLNETGRIEHGLKHNVWYKSLWDVIHV
ncbi:Exostosin-3 [Escovopsis weberi]|uniref:Exostosin-3 n=1 Tax=Escovopsis weberi TaxID=150374 RepID=A0A0M8N706_ESCWE|nr:Exostosin-3 [Escovopsis weberi]